MYPPEADMYPNEYDPYATVEEQAYELWLEAKEKKEWNTSPQK